MHSHTLFNYGVLQRELGKDIQSAMYIQKAIDIDYIEELVLFYAD
jgi:hypothetical protein